MTPRRWRAVAGRIHAWAVVTFCVTALAIGWGFLRAGAWLVAQDPFTDADAALVLSGLPVSRSLAARDLYRQGRVKRILVIPEPPTKIDGEVVGEQVMRELVQLGLVDPTLPQMAERILEVSGVPRSRILMLPEPANGTIVEAQEVRQFLNGRFPKSLVLITSKSASRRARLIFRQVFRRTGVSVVSSPTPYDSFEPRRWWSKPRQALTVVTEYEKLAVNGLQLALERH